MTETGHNPPTNLLAEASLANLMVAAGNITLKQAYDILDALRLNGYLISKQKQ